MLIVEIPISFKLQVIEDSPNLVQIRSLARQSCTDIEAFIIQAINDHYERVKDMLAGYPN